MFCLAVQAASLGFEPFDVFIPGSDSLKALKTRLKLMLNCDAITFNMSRWNEADGRWVWVPASEFAVVAGTFEGVGRPDDFMTIDSTVLILPRGEWPGPEHAPPSDSQRSASASGASASEAPDCDA